MNIIRSDKQVALNDLLVAAKETVDHYQEAPDLIEDSSVNTIFSSIAQGRKPLIDQLENAIRALGDLPSAPDPDKETGTMLLHHAGALLTEDYLATFVDQRLRAEEQLAELINVARITGLEEYCGLLINHVDENVEQAIKQLQEIRPLA
jgi:hypothetical protein